MVNAAMASIIVSAVVPTTAVAYQVAPVQTTNRRPERAA
jgi:hypothetical protein